MSDIAKLADSTEMPHEIAELLRNIADNPELMEAAHLAIEDHLVKMRDAGMFTGPHGNGFVVREEDGSPSEVIRMGTRPGIVMALNAIADRIDAARGL